MAIILGVFDLLAYAVPGSLYLSVFAYTSSPSRLDRCSEPPGLPSVLLIAVAVAAFLTGQASYPLGSMIDRINPFGSIDLPGEAKEEFLRRNAVAAQRRFLQLDPFTLPAALEADDSEAAGRSPD